MNRSILKANAPLLELAVRAADPLLAIAAGVLAYRYIFGGWSLPESYWLFLLGAAMACMAAFPLIRVYEPRRGMALVVEIRLLAFAWVLVAASVFAFFFATKSGADFSRVWIAVWLGSAFALNLAVRIALRLVLRALRARGRNQRHIVIAGAGTLGQDVAARLVAASWTGIRVWGYFDDAPEHRGAMHRGLPVLGTLADLPAQVERTGIDQVWIALPLKAEETVKELLSALQRTSAQICFVPDIYGFHLLHHSVTEVAGMPVINLTDTPLTGVSSVLKTVEDFVIGACALLIATPLMLAIAVGIKLDSKGPVLYRQERLTWNGSRFLMLKFRSMPVDAEAATGPVWSGSGERRATRFGAWLRRWSLDELPQLFNVLRGEMSLVGPRPERPEFVERFRAEIPGYMQKHLVKGGITGWAQVNDLRGNTDLRKRIEFDLYYIENWSIWFDLRILALTALRVFTSRHAY